MIPRGLEYFCENNHDVHCEKINLFEQHVRLFFIKTPPPPPPRPESIGRRNLRAREDQQGQYRLLFSFDEQVFITMYITDFETNALNYLGLCGLLIGCTGLSADI